MLTMSLFSQFADFDSRLTAPRNVHVMLVAKARNANLQTYSTRVDVECLISSFNTQIKKIMIL